MPAAKALTPRRGRARRGSRVPVIRADYPLSFANAERALAAVRELLHARAEVQVLVLSPEESVDRDSTALEALSEVSA